MVQNLIGKADEKIKVQVENLINGESIEVPLRETITYGDMYSVGESIWSFLYFTNI